MSTALQASHAALPSSAPISCGNWNGTTRLPLHLSRPKELLPNPMMDLWGNFFKSRKSFSDNPRTFQQINFNIKQLRPLFSKSTLFLSLRNSLYSIKMQLLSSNIHQNNLKGKATPNKEHQVPLSTLTHPMEFRKTLRITWKSTNQNMLQIQCKTVFILLIVFRVPLLPQTLKTIKPTNTSKPHKIKHKNLIDFFIFRTSSPKITSCKKPHPIPKNPNPIKKISKPTQSKETISV